MFLAHLRFKGAVSYRIPPYAFRSMFCVSVLSVNCKSILYIFQTLHTIQKAHAEEHGSGNQSQRTLNTSPRFVTAPQARGWLHSSYLPPNMLKVR